VFLTKGDESMTRRAAGDSIDVHVGKKIRDLRIKKGLSQSDLAKKLDISFQQLQKNERGTNRVGCSRLWELSQALMVPVSYFFEGLPTTVMADKTLPEATIHLSASTKAKKGNGFNDKELKEFAVNFEKVPKENRKVLLSLVRGMVKQ
jgi:transcriptional regulator with XRE-family HTH domain